MDSDVAELVERLEYTAKNGLLQAANDRMYATHEDAASTIRALVAEKEQATAYLRNLVCAFCKEHFPENADWRPLPDLLGMLTQMDNASTVARDYHAKLREAVEVIRKIAEPVAPRACLAAHWRQGVAFDFLATREKPNG